MKYFSFILHPPSFEDEDKRRAAALLHLILVSTAIANFATIILLILSADEKLGPVSANILILLIQIGLFVLLWKGQVRVSGFLVTIATWSIISIEAYANTGILNPIFGVQTVVIVIAGLLINEWAGLFFALLSSVFGLWLVQAANAGKYINAVGTISVELTWKNETTAFGLVSLLLFLSLRTIREARKQAIEHSYNRRHSDERYRSLVENAPDTIFTLDQNHFISFLNRSTIGPVQTLLGRNVYDLIHPDSREVYRAAVNRVFELGSTEQIEIQNLSPNEESSWYSVRFAPIKEDRQVIEVTAVATDITEQKRAEDALRASEEQYRILFEANPHPMVVTDETGTFLAVNDAAVAKYGYNREEFVGSSATLLRPQEELAEAGKSFEKARQENLAIVNLGVSRHRKKDGAIVFAEVTSHRFNYQGQRAIVTAAYDLTERLRAEVALRESEARLSGIIESAMDAIITINENQFIVQFNKAAEIMFHTSAEECIGQPITKLIPERFGQVHGEHIRAFGKAGVTNRHMGALGAISGVRADGEEFPIEASISQVEVATGKYYTVILRDITERKRAEENLRQSEELFSMIFQYVPVGIGIVSLTTGKIRNVNDYVLTLTGYDAVEIVGRPIAEAPYWVHPDQWQQVSEPISEGQSSSGVEIEWRTKAGQILTILGSSIQVDIQGESCILGLAVDITERKQTERMRLQVYKERDLLELKERFISTMSHEFRTPLAVILSASDSLRHYHDRMGIERREEHFNNIEQQIRYAVKLLDDVLTLSKERAGKMPFTPAPMNLVRFCEKLFEQMQTTDTTRHEFTFVNDGKIDEIEGDEKLLQHILINLISNAIKYSPDGGEVRFELRREGDEAVMQVSDQGIGIPEEDQKHLFKPFYRASNTHSINGTGLGLAIVKESVDTHHGTIYCKSATGQGTSFVIQLPITAKSNLEKPS